MQVLLLLILGLQVALVIPQEIWRPRHLGTFPQKHPAFVQLFASSDPDVNPLDKYTIYISTFDGFAVFQHDDIWYMRSPGRSLNNSSKWNMTRIDSTHYWPNDCMSMPSEVIGTEGILWTSGFLIPGKMKGELSIYLTTTDPLDGPYNIASLDDQNYSYHRIEWHDANHDGFLDVIAARYHFENGVGIASTVWLENPGLEFPTEGWTQHVFQRNALDINFHATTFSVSGQEFFVLVGAEFWNNRLAIHYAEDGSDSFLTDSSTLLTRVVEDDVGFMYDVTVTDLNLDGTPEILLSTYNNVTRGFVNVYLLPNDFRTGVFERKIIAEGFIPVLEGDSYLSPGAMRPFYRDVVHENSGGKPYVLVSGDDDGSFYILTPESENPADWNYSKNVFINTNGTIAGSFAVADLDNDGYNEVVTLGYTVKKRSLELEGCSSDSEPRLF